MTCKHRAGATRKGLIVVYRVTQDAERLGNLEKIHGCPLRDFTESCTALAKSRSSDKNEMVLRITESNADRDLYKLDVTRKHFCNGCHAS